MEKEQKEQTLLKVVFLSTEKDRVSKYLSKLEEEYEFVFVDTVAEVKESFQNDRELFGLIVGSNVNSDVRAAAMKWALSQLPQIKVVDIHMTDSLKVWKGGVAGKISRRFGTKSKSSRISRKSFSAAFSSKSGMKGLQEPALSDDEDE